MGMAAALSSPRLFFRNRKSGPGGNATRTVQRSLALAGILALAAAATAVSPAYDPLATGLAQGTASLDLVVHDGTRQRDLPLRIYLPPDDRPAPVLLFSHGLGGSREGSAYLGRHWAARGYLAVFLQHPGSDTSVWQDEPPARRMAAMRQAASGQNFLLRVRDVPAVLDQLDRWNRAAGHALAGRLNLEKVGMSGHSFGAVTTQAVSGQSFAGGGARLTDPRIDAALLMSPSSPNVGTPPAAFGRVTLPWLLMTGTRDTSPINTTDVQSRLAVYPALPPGHKYELVLHGAEHSAFTDRALPGETGARNPNHHRVILALSTAFWDTYLRDDPAARAWLTGDGARSVLEKDDRWQMK